MTLILNPTHTFHRIGIPWSMHGISIYSVPRRLWTHVGGRILSYMSSPRPGWHLAGCGAHTRARTLDTDTPTHKSQNSETERAAVTREPERFESVCSDIPLIRAYRLAPSFRVPCSVFRRLQNNRSLFTGIETAPHCAYFTANYWRTHDTALGIPFLQGKCGSAKTC